MCMPFKIMEGVFCLCFVLFCKISLISSLWLRADGPNYCTFVAGTCMLLDCFKHPFITFSWVCPFDCTVEYYGLNLINAMNVEVLKLTNEVWWRCPYIPHSYILHRFILVHDIDNANLELYISHLHRIFTSTYCKSNTKHCVVFTCCTALALMSIRHILWVID